MEGEGGRVVRGGEGERGGRTGVFEGPLWDSSVSEWRNLVH